MSRQKKKSERKKERKGKEEKTIGNKRAFFSVASWLYPYTAKVRDGEIGKGRNQGKCLVLFSLIGCQEMHQCFIYQRRLFELYSEYQ